MTEDMAKRAGKMMSNARDRAYDAMLKRWTDGFAEPIGVELTTEDIQRAKERLGMTPEMVRSIHETLAASAGITTAEMDEMEALIEEISPSHPTASPAGPSTSAR